MLLGQSRAGTHQHPLPDEGTSTKAIIYCITVRRNQMSIFFCPQLSFFILGYHKNSRMDIAIQHCLAAFFVASISTF